MALGIFDEAASESGRDIDIGVHLRGGVSERTEPAGRKASAGLAVPLVEADAFPAHDPEAPLAIFQKIRNPVGPVQVPGFCLLFGKGAAEAVLLHHFPVLPYLPSGIVPKAHVNRAGAVFVQGGDPLFGRSNPEFAGMVFQKGGYLGGRDKPDLLQGRRQHGEAIVASYPDIALSVFEDAVEFVG